MTTNLKNWNVGPNLTRTILLALAWASAWGLNPRLGAAESRSAGGGEPAPARVVATNQTLAATPEAKSAEAMATLQRSKLKEFKATDAATQKQLLEEEIKLLEVELEQTRKLVETGHAPQNSVFPFQRERLRLRRELAALEEQEKGGAGIGAAKTPATAVTLRTDRDPAPPASGRIAGLDSKLATGVVEEEANLDLNAAVQSYRSVLTQFDGQRPLAAHALFRLGECYRKLGRMEEAKAQYARVIREFPDQTYLAQLCAHATNEVARLEARLKEARPQAGQGRSSNSSNKLVRDQIEWEQRKSRLESAQSNLARLRDLHDRKLASQSEIEAAQLATDIAAAELKGDVTEEARLKLNAAESHLARQRELNARKLASQSEVEAAQVARDLAAAELSGDAAEVARLKLQCAERDFKQVEGQRAAHLASQEEYEKAKRARDDAEAAYSKLARLTETRIFALRRAQATNLVATLQPLLSPECKVVADARTNALIVSGHPAQLSALERLIQRLDATEPPPL